MMQAFAEWLRAELHTRAMSQAELARAVHVSPNTVLNWMRGAQPSWENCQQIASALDADVSTVRRLAGYDHDGAALGLHYEPTAEEWEAIKEFARGLRGAADGAQTGTEDGKRAG